MACRLDGTKPLPEPKKIPSTKWRLNSVIIYSQKCLFICLFMRTIYMIEIQDNLQNIIWVYHCIKQSVGQTSISFTSPHTWDAILSKFNPHIWCSYVLFNCTSIPIIWYMTIFILNQTCSNLLLRMFWFTSMPNWDFVCVLWNNVYAVPFFSYPTSHWGMCVTIRCEIHEEEANKKY